MLRSTVSCASPLGTVRGLTCLCTAEEILEQNCKKGQYSEVAVVYLKGTISNASGPGSAAEAIKGLKEAGEDERIKSVVLRESCDGTRTAELLADDVRRQASTRAAETSLRLTPSGRPCAAARRSTRSRSLPRTAT